MRVLYKILLACAVLALALAVSAHAHDILHGTATYHNQPVEYHYTTYDGGCLVDVTIKARFTRRDNWNYGVYTGTQWDLESFEESKVYNCPDPLQTMWRNITQR